jgi:dihydrofolate synthase/folylpolyglutamate synthase
MSVSILQKTAQKAGLTGTIYTSVKSALKAAKKMALADDLIFIGGSTFTVAEIL